MKQIGMRIWKDICVFKWIIIGFLIYYTLSHTIFGAYCPMLLIWGLPCPGCGMSRAIYFILTFQFSRGWDMNPIAYLWVLYIMCFLISRYVLGKSVKKLQPVLITVLIATITFYVYRMMFQFPSYPPMVYRKENLMESFFPEYGQIIRIIFK